jgi:hypothetical protein
VEEAELNLSDIHNALFAGKKLELEFETPEEAEAFRVRLAQYKARQDKQMQELGMQGEGERSRFSFQVQGRLPPGDTLFPVTGTVTAILEYKEKVAQKLFKVRILGDSDGEGTS